MVVLHMVTTIHIYTYVRTYEDTYVVMYVLKEDNYIHTLFLLSICAPLESNKSIILELPALAAACSGVSPSCNKNNSIGS